MEKWDPVHLEAAPRYKVVRALYEEISQGRGPVTCNLEQVAQSILDGPDGLGHGNLALVHKRQAVGIGTVRSSFEWGIAIHRLLGGCSTDETTATTVKGLFAAGESAGGVHGAARLAGQAVLEFLAMGARAGKHAARLARQVSWVEPDRKVIKHEEQQWQKISEKTGGVSPRKVIHEVQEIMGRYVSVSREGKGLQTAVHQLDEIVHEKVPRIASKKLREAMEAANLSKTGWLVARAALERRESRGSHWRADYPERDDAHWLTHIAFQREGEEMTMVTRPVIKKP
jgi:succinate dehydrogenase/fumarate reductase flavoprotein subunit